VIFGISMLFNSKISFSFYRSILFGYMPIITGIFILLLKIEYKIIAVNSFFFFIAGTILFEISLIYLEKNSIKNSMYDMGIYPPHIGCGGINSHSPANYKFVQNIELYPLSGKSHTLASLENRLTMELSTHNTDNHGFKNPFDWDSKTLVDYVFIGDSFTYGTDVIHGEAFPEIFRDRHPLTINLGCGGTGPIMQLGIYLEYAKMLKPQYVIWNFYSGNDLNSDIVTELNSFYAQYLKNNFTQNLINKQTKIDLINDIFISKLKSDSSIKKNENKINEVKKYKDFYKYRKLKTRFGLQHSFDPNNLEILKKILLKINKDVKIFDGKFIFNFIPTPNRYVNFFHKFDHDSYYSYLFDFLKNNSIEYINFSDELNKYDNPIKFYSGHLNSSGNKLLAKIIIDKVEQ